jgi:hypothetical protein
MMLTFVGLSGQTVYAQILDDAGQWWNVASANFEPFAASQWQDCAIGMIETGATGVYNGSVPATVPNGDYSVVYRRQLGNDPDPADLAIGAETLRVGAGVALSEATVGVAS